MAVKLGNGKWAVKENNLLAYNDNSGQFFNKEFDFTRGSSATYVGKDGLIKTAGLQDTNLVQNGDFSQLGSELITNLDFENGWGVLNATIDDFNSFTSTVSFGYIRLNNILTVGKTYILKIQGTTTSIGNVAFNIRRYGGSSYYKTGITGTFNETFTFTALDEGIFLSNEGLSTTVIDSISVKQVDPNDEWSLGSGVTIGENKIIGTNANSNTYQNASIQSNKRYKIQFTILDYSNGNARIILNGSPNVVSADFSSDGNHVVYLNSVSGSNGNLSIQLYNNFNGSISNISVQEIQVNTPRIDFSDSADGSLLLEPQSTNLVEYSEPTAPEGNMNGVTYESFAWDNGFTNCVKYGNASNIYHYFNYTLLDATTYTLSFFVQMDDGSEPQIGSGVVNDFRIELADAQNYGSNITKTLVIGSVWKITKTETTVVGRNFNGIRKILNSPKGFRITGYQLEQLSYATSYIPTQGSASTRIAETCTNSGSAQDFNSEEGVLYAEISALSDVTSLNFLSLSDGTINNRVTIGLDNNNYNCQVRKDGTAVFDISGILTNVKLFNKIAVSYAENNFSLWINGTKVATDTSGLTPIGLNQLDFNLPERPYDFYGKFKSVEVFTKALSDEELQKLTTI